MQSHLSVLRQQQMSITPPSLEQLNLTSDITVTETSSVALSNKTLTSPVNGTLSGTAFLDEDSFGSNSATMVSTIHQGHVDAIRVVHQV